MSEAVHVLARDGASRGRGSDAAGVVAIDPVVIAVVGGFVGDIVDVVVAGGGSKIPRGAHRSPSTAAGGRRWRYPDRSAGARRRSLITVRRRRISTSPAGAAGVVVVVGIVAVFFVVFAPPRPPPADAGGVGRRSAEPPPDDDDDGAAATASAPDDAASAMTRTMSSLIPKHDLSAPSTVRVAVAVAVAVVAAPSPPPRPPPPPAISGSRHPLSRLRRPVAKMRRK